MNEFYKRCRQMLLMKKDTFENRLDALQLSGSNGDLHSQKDVFIRIELCAKLARVERCLQWIENNQYGYCESCGSKINRQRLLFIPEAEYCTSCEKKRERAIH